MKIKKPDRKNFLKGPIYELIFIVIILVLVFVCLMLSNKLGDARRELETTKKALANLQTSYETIMETNNSLSSQLAEKREEIENPDDGITEITLPDDLQQQKDKEWEQELQEHLEKLEEKRK